MKKYLFATMALVAMTSIWSCSDDNEQSDDPISKDTRTVVPEGYTVWEDADSSHYVDIKIYMLDKDGKNRLTREFEKSNKYCQWEPRGWYSLYFAEYKGCHIYDMIDGMGSKSEGIIHPQPHPDDFSWPEGFHGGFSQYCDNYEPSLCYIKFGPIVSDEGSDETVIFHWSDGSTDTVSYKIVRSIDDNKLYIGFFLNGRITEWPIELVKEY